MAHLKRQSYACLVVLCVCVLLLLNAYSNDPLFVSLQSTGGGEAGQWEATSASASVPGQDGDAYTYSAGHQGLTMCVSEDPAMLTSAKYLLQQLRSEWRSALPVAIAHCGELSRATTDELHSLHRASTLAQFGRNLTLLMRASLHITDLCAGASLVKKRRLRGWFCKTMALLEAPFTQTMLVDTDIVWFQSPELLFSATPFLRTGALFFRDRLLYELPPHASDSGLRFDAVKNFVDAHSGRAPIDSAAAARLLRDSGNNFLWRRALNATSGLRHVQESSVVVVDRSRMPKTMATLRRLLPSFSLGYGDKEVYWVAATIAGEAYSLEPWLAGAYGDCGEVLHFDPRVPADAARPPEPFFLNGQYLSEGVEYEARGVQGRMTRPVAASTALDLDSLVLDEQRDRVTGGNCGACRVGCMHVPTDVSAAIIRQQRYQLARVDPNFKHSLAGILYFAAKRALNKVLPAN